MGITGKALEKIGTIHINFLSVRRDMLQRHCKNGQAEYAANERGKIRGYLLALRNSGAISDTEARALCIYFTAND